MSFVQLASMHDAKQNDALYQCHAITNLRVRQPSTCSLLAFDRLKVLVIAFSGSIGYMNLAIVFSGTYVCILFGRIHIRLQIMI